MKRKNRYLITKSPSFPNRNVLLHVRCNLVKSDEKGNKYGIVATCAIPSDSAESIQLIQSKVNYQPLAKPGRIEQLRINIEGADGELLPYRNGRFNIVIHIRKAK